MRTSGRPRPLGNRHPSIAPYETYEAADRPFAPAAGNDSLWRRLCVELDLEEPIDDERFATNSARVAHIDELGEILDGVFAKADAATWVERLGAAGVPAGLINDVGEAFDFAVRLNLEPVVEAPGAKTGFPLRLVRSPLRMSETPVTVEHPPPQLGQHSEEIREWLRQKSSTSLNREPNR